MRRAFAVLAATAAAAAATLVGAGGALATMEGHQVSVVNPFAACPLTPDIFGGVNYPNTELEPWVARNPANPDNMIGGFQQDRWSDGGAKGLVAAYSFNDGLKWDNVALPFSKCAIPAYGPAPCPTNGVGSPVPCTMPYDRASDPWVDVGPDGRAYQVSISFNANDNNNALGATVSTDGGVTWGLTTEVVHDVDSDPLFPFNDKESVTADPVKPGTAYVVWDRLVLVNCGSTANTFAQPQAADDRVWHPRSRGSETGEALDCFEGPTFFSKTVDGGHTWSPARQIVSNLPDEQTISNQIVVDPRTGRLYDFYIYFPNVPPFTPEIRTVYSNDGGTTWSPQQFVNTNETVGIHDPQNPDAFARTGDIIPEPAIDPATGQLYVVWQDGRYNENEQDDVLVSTSVQGGLTGTWTVPQRIDLPADRAGFTPGIKVNDRGQLGVDYYSLRHPDLGPDVWPVDRYLRISDGPAVVSTPTPGQAPVAAIDFDTPTHVTGPFNMLMAPDAGGFFVGDYESMVIDRDGRRFHTYFAQTNCDTTNCPAVGYAAPATGTFTPPAGKTSSPPDPMDVYTNKYFSNG
jgi:hypothetical protein